MLFQQALYMVLFSFSLPMPTITECFQSHQNTGRCRAEAFPLPHLRCWAPLAVPCATDFADITRLQFPAGTFQRWLTDSLTQTQARRSQVNSWHPSAPANSCRSPKFSTVASEVTPEQILTCNCTHKPITASSAPARAVCDTLRSFPVRAITGISTELRGLFQAGKSVLWWSKKYWLKCTEMVNFTLLWLKNKLCVAGIWSKRALSH